MKAIVAGLGLMVASASDVVAAFADDAGVPHAIPGYPTGAYDIKLGGDRDVC